MPLQSSMDGSLLPCATRIDRGGAEMRSDPEDEPGIYLAYAFIMFVAIIAAAVIAAGIMVHVSL